MLITALVNIKSDDTVFSPDNATKHWKCATVVFVVIFVVADMKHIVLCIE